MTANPYIIDRRAKSIQDLRASFEIIDAKRWEWAARLLAEAGRASAAELAASFAAEHRTVAATLNGEREIGSDERVAS